MSKLSEMAVKVQLQDMTKEALKDLTIAEKEWLKEEKKKGLR